MRFRQRERETQTELEEALKQGNDEGKGILFDSSCDFSTKVEGLITRLEQLNNVENPSRSAKLFGMWQLIFTNSPPMLKNKGLTGLGSLPFASLVELEQNLYSNSTAETIETLNIPPFGSVRSSLRGPMLAATPQVFEKCVIIVRVLSRREQY